MSYFTTHLSFTLLVKEFLKLVNIGEVTGKMVTASCAPFALHFCHQRCWSRRIVWTISVLRTETVTNRCYVNKQIMWVYYQQASNFCRPVLTYWLTDWHHQAFNICWLWCFSLCFSIWLTCNAPMASVLLVMGALQIPDNYDGDDIWSVADRLLIMYGIFAATAFLCCGSCVQWVMGFFIWPMSTTFR